MSLKLLNFISPVTPGLALDQLNSQHNYKNARVGRGEGLCWPGLGIQNLGLTETFMVHIGVPDGNWFSVCVVPAGSKQNLNS